MCLTANYYLIYNSLILFYGNNKVFLAMISNWKYYAIRNMIFVVSIKKIKNSSGNPRMASCNHNFTNKS